MFNAVLKELRKKNGLTQAQLAKAVDVSPGNVGDWETGKSKPGYNALIALARIFEVSADYLLELDTIKEKGQETTLSITIEETNLVLGFRELSNDDKEEFLEILQLKLHKTRKNKKNDPTSFNCTDTERNDMIG